MQPVFIYFLKDPTNPIRGYVGKSANPARQFRTHFQEVKNEKHRRANWLKALLAAGLRPELEIIAQVPKSEWQQWETDYIAAFRTMGFELMNGTDGGDGTDGYVHTLETKAKLRALRLGTKHSAETLAQFSEMRQGDKNSFFGKSHTPEANEKNRLAHLGKKAAPETCAKMSISRTGKKRTPETCAKMSANMLGEKNPNFGKPGTFLGKKHSDETRAAMVEAWNFRKLKKSIDKLLPRTHYL